MVGEKVRKEVGESVIARTIDRGGLKCILFNLGCRGAAAAAPGRGTTSPSSHSKNTEPIVASKYDGAAGVLVCHKSFSLLSIASSSSVVESCHTSLPQPDSSTSACRRRRKQSTAPMQAAN